MALVPVYVRATDGKLYSNPLICDRGLTVNWYICFDDKDHPEIVLDHKEYTSRGRAKSASKEILQRLNLVFELMPEVLVTTRLFPEQDTYGPRKANVLHFILKSRIPVPSTYGQVLSQDPKFPCLIFDYGVDVRPFFKGELT